MPLGHLVDARHRFEFQHVGLGIAPRDLVSPADTVVADASAEGTLGAAPSTVTASSVSPRN